MTNHHDEHNLPDFESGEQVARQAFTAFAIIIALVAVVVGGVLFATRDTSDDSDTAAATPTEQAEPTPEETTPAEPNPCPTPEGEPPAEPKQFDAAPDPKTAPKGTSNATIATSCGDIKVELYGDKAPQAVANFAMLAKEDYYNNTPCHRMTDAGIFVLQCGDPTGTGTGSPGYGFGPIENAPADDKYPTATLAMARQGGKADSMGSQFFIVYDESMIPSDQAGGYTVFGKVTEGMDVVTKIVEGGVGPDGTAPARPISLTKVTLQ